MTSNKKVSFNELSFAIVPVFKNLVVALHCPAFISLITGYKPVFLEELEQKIYILMHCFNSIVVGKDTNLTKKGVVDSINAPPDLPPLKEKMGIGKIWNFWKNVLQTFLFCCAKSSKKEIVPFTCFSCSVQRNTKTITSSLMDIERRSYA